MKRFSWFCSYAVEFTICAFCGWLYEVLLELIVYHAYTDRGLLHLPVCPIYGVFGMILLLLFRKQNGIVVFIGSTLLTTVLELGSSYLLERIGYIPWDYSDWICNFEGRISLFSSLIFGVLALFLIKVVHPLVRKFNEKSPDWLVGGMGVLFAIVILGDTLRTLILPRFL